MLAANTMVNNRYRIVRLIGQDGMGDVYEAVDTRLKATVALRRLTIPAQGARAFEHAARLLTSLHHPALPLVNDYFTAHDQQFLVMQYLSGDDLAALLARRQAPFPLANALIWADRLLDALDYLHRQNPPIIHHDIKPANLKFTDAGDLVLLGAGLNGDPPRSHVSRAGGAGYTLQYAPLEQIQGGSTDPRSDLYSLAATLYHLLMNIPPPDALSRAAALIARRPDPLRSLTEPPACLPPPVAVVLHQALALKPEDRPAAAAILREQLRSVAPPPDSAPASHAETIYPSALTKTPQSARLLESPAPSIAEPGGGNRAEAPEVLLSVAGEEAAEALENERRRLAEALQINVVDPLTLLLAQAGIYEQTMAGNQPVRLVVSVLTSLARQALQQARDMGDALNPAIVDELGLEPALESLAGQIQRAHGVKITLELERQRERAPRKIELALFRAAQEVAERAIRYGRAARMHIALVRTPARLHLQIGDDGARDAGIGLLTPAGRRIEQLGGSFEIGSSPYGGALVSVSMPVRSADLTTREMDVLRLIAEGRSNKQIGLALNISPRTVNFHLDNIYAKLGVRSRTEAAVFALRFLDPR